MFGFLARLFGSAAPAALNVPPPPPPEPPGFGWRIGDQEPDGKWSVWRGPHRMASFWDRDEAEAWARRMNEDPPRVTDESGHGAGLDLSEGLTAAKLERETLRAHISNPEVVIEPKDPSLAQFLNVPIPRGVRAVVGPLPHPEDGKYYVFDRSGPLRGYTRRSNAKAAAERINAG